MEQVLANPRTCEDLLNREIGRLVRLVDIVLARHPLKKPCQSVPRPAYELVGN